MKFTKIVYEYNIESSNKFANIDDDVRLIVERSSFDQSAT